MSCEFTEYKKPKARKQYLCCECYLPIPKGCQYEYIAGKWDGEFQSFKLHLECDSLRNDLHKESGGSDDENYIGSLHDYLGSDELVDPRIRDRLAVITKKYRHGRRKRRPVKKDGRSFEGAVGRWSCRRYWNLYQVPHGTWSTIEAKKRREQHV